MQKEFESALSHTVEWCSQCLGIAVSLTLNLPSKYTYEDPYFKASVHKVAVMKRNIFNYTEMNYQF